MRMENKNLRGENRSNSEVTARDSSIEIPESLLEMPSSKTFEMWIEKGEARRRKRLKKRMFMSTAAVLVVCCGTVIGAKLMPIPSVEAEPDNTIEISSGMETTTEYKSWDALPEDIKNEFIEITVFPEGYEVEKIVVVDGKGARNLEIYLHGKDIKKAYIRESIYTDKTLNYIDTSNLEKVYNIETVDVYTENYDKGFASYKFIYKELIFDISLPESIIESYLSDLIKTVQ